MLKKRATENVGRNATGWRVFLLIVDNECSTTETLNRGLNGCILRARPLDNHVRITKRGRPSVSVKRFDKEGPSC